MKDSEIRKRLKAAILCLSAVLILSVVSGAVLLNSIGSTNGWAGLKSRRTRYIPRNR